MPISKTSELLRLIQSLSKAEKRNFRLYAQRNYSDGQLKFILLFDIIEKSKEYDEAHIIHQLGKISKSKLANMKRHLYSQILNSLRVVSFSKKPNVQLRGLLDYAYILYDKAFYMEAIKVLYIAKKHAKKYYLYYMHLTIIEFEKRIESRHITRSGKDKAYALIQEANEVNKKVADSTKLSNLRTHLHGKYIQNGHCQSKEEQLQLEAFFEQSLLHVDEEELGPIEKVYLYQSYVWYHHILLDFQRCLIFAKRWLAVLDENPVLIERDEDLYLRAYHYILSSTFHLRDLENLNTYLEQAEAFRKKNYKGFSSVTKMISFQYIHTSRLNKIIISGDFHLGQASITRSLKRIKTYGSNLDAHRVLVFYYKFAWIYFGNKKYSNAIYYLNKIINNELPKLREDLQIYARLLFLMCHFELRNYDLFKYFIKSFQPYFRKLANISPLQKITQDAFLKLAHSPRDYHKSIMKETLTQLKILQSNSFHNVSFTYLDIISWLESKIKETPMSEIVKNKLK